MSITETDFDIQTSPKVLQYAKETWPNRPALKFKNETITYHELYEKVARLTKGFENIGIKKGDHVAVLISGYPEWFYISYALSTLGAVIVPINITWKKQEILYVLCYSDVKVLITMDKFRNVDYIALFKELIPELEHASAGFLEAESCPRLETVISISKGQHSHAGCFDYEDILHASVKYNTEKTEYLINNVMPDDTAYILFTSGSTAFPKPVLRSHGSNIGIAHYISPDLTQDDIFIHYLPFYHIAGCVYIALGSALKGACIVLMESFNPSEALKLIEEEKITHLGGFDTHFQMLTSQPSFNETDFSSVKRILLAGGPEWYTKLKEIGFKHSIIDHHYGFTEGTGVIMPSNETDEKFKKESNGKPFPGIEVKIVDSQTGETLPPNVPGEICLKGWTLFQGYYKMPKETADVMDEQGFFHTGDYGWLNEAGYVYYRGRYKNMIKTGGENVSEREVEMYLESHSEIKAVQVIGIPDSKWGEVVTAVVETHSGDELTLEDMKAFCVNSISNIKTPKYIFNMANTAWPITPTGKFNKKALREIVMESLER